MKFQEGGGGSEEGKTFFKLKDKESAKVVFRGDPYEYKQHWINQRGVICVGSEQCPHCKAGNKPGFRFRINLLMNENGVFVSKIWEQGWTVYNQLKDIHADYDLEKTIVKVARSGSGQNDTSYSILPIPNGAVSMELNQKLSQVPLQVLQHVPPSNAATPEQPPHPADAPSNGFENGPVAAADNDDAFL